MRPACVLIISNSQRPWIYYHFVAWVDTQAQFINANIHTTHTYCTFSVPFDLLCFGRKIVELKTVYSACDIDN